MFYLPPRKWFTAAGLLLTNLLQAQCPVELEGTHSMCSAKYDYVISNYTATSSYQAYAVVNGVSTANFTILSNGSFSAGFPVGTTQAMVIVKITSPCQSADTIWVQPCCSNDPIGSNVLSDISSSQIPSIVQVQGNYVYDPTLYNQPSVVVIHGQLTISQVTEFYNTTLLMDQGASIRIKSGKELVLINSTVQAGCGSMWEGIICDDNSKFKIRNHSTIRDAQYGLKCKGYIIFDMYDNIQFINNYSGVYFEPNAAGNTMFLSSAISVQDININWNGTPLLPNFYGQNPVAQSRSYAGFIINDMANFNNSPSGGSTLGISISNTTLGIAGFRSNLTLPGYVTISNMVATAGQYSQSANYNGTGIYCEATSGSPKTLTVGTSNTQRAVIQNTRYGVYVNNHMNLNCRYNLIQNTSGMGAIRMLSCTGRSLQVFHNTITNGFHTGIHGQTISGSTLQIYGNNINNGSSYLPAGTSLGNTAIYVTNRSLSTITGYISNNTINSSRVGIDVSNVQGSSAATAFVMANNTVNISRANNQLVDYSIPINLPWLHYGIKLSGTANLMVKDNVIRRTVVVPSTGVVPGYRNIIYGIETNLTGNNTVIKNNTLYDCGTFVQVIANCQGTLFQCNTCSLTVVNTGNSGNTQGFYFNSAQLGNQGSATVPSDNKWEGWGTAATPYRLAGMLSSSFTWYHRSSNNKYYATPASVSPPNYLTINATATGQGPCSSENPSGEALRELLTRIIHDEIAYEYFADESRYQDRCWAFNILHEDAALRSSDAEFEDFYESLLDDNIGDFNTIQQYLSDEDYASAMAMLQGMVDQNSIDYNLAYTLEIAASMLEDPGYELNQEQQEELSRIAYITVWEGGPGVLNARSIMDLEVIDQMPYLRKTGNEAQTTRRMNSVGQLLRKCPDGSITVYSREGKEVFEGIVADFAVKQSQLVSGVYAYKVQYGKELITGKWSLNR